MTRRQILAGAATAVAASAAAASGTQAQAQATAPSAATQLLLCLNTSTIRGQKLSLTEEIRLASEAGYTAIEPWIREIQDYQQQGGKLSDLRKLLSDSGLQVPSAIGFAKWIVDDEGERAKGLEEAKRDMGTVAEIGGTRIAAPPAGATEKAGLSLDAAAERYGKLLELGREMGVVPQLEVWGFSANLHKLGQVAYVAAESGHEDACILPDVYHIYKGGSDFTALSLIHPAKIHVFHINDYPADPPRATIKDADRVYPGDGVAPLAKIFGPLLAAGFRGALSLELFNPTYYQQEASVVVKEGIAKIRATLEACRNA